MSILSDKGNMVSGFALICFIWGSTWLAIKIGLESMPPFYGIAFRFTLAYVILFLLMRARGEKLHFDRNSWLVFTVLGAFSFSIPFALVYWGEQYVPSGLASVLFAVYPFVVAVFSHFFLHGERMNVYKFVGILLGFAGIVVIFWQDLSWEKDSLHGMFAIVTSTVLQGISLVTVKKRAHHIPPVTLSVGGLSVGLVIMYVLAFAFDDPSRIQWDEKSIGSILYLGSFGTVVTFVIYYWLLKRMEAVYLSLMALITPIVAVILGALILGEVLTPHVAAGSSLVLAGILVANGRDVFVAVRRARA